MAALAARQRRLTALCLVVCSATFIGCGFTRPADPPSGFVTQGRVSCSSNTARASFDASALVGRSTSEAREFLARRRCALVVRFENGEWVGSMLNVLSAVDVAVVDGRVLAVRS